MLWNAQVETARLAAVSSVTRQRSAVDSAAAAPECRDGSDEQRPGTRAAAAGRLVGLPQPTMTYDHDEQMGAGHLRSAGARRQPLSSQVLRKQLSPVRAVVTLKPAVTVRCWGWSRLREDRNGVPLPTCQLQISRT